MKEGIKNEYNFINNLDGKLIEELPFLLQELVYTLFKVKNKTQVVHCYKNIEYEKGDICIIVGCRKKYISIKMGNKNSVHSESISKFIKFLKKICIDKTTINNILKYHYADGTIDGTGKYRISVSEYKLYNKNLIDNINKKLNKECIMNDFVKRFLIKGTNWYYHKIDALICGTPDDFLFVLEEDIYKYIKYKTNITSSAIHFSCLTYQPLSRVLDYNKKYEYRRHWIQIKWYNLEDNIIELLCLKERNFIPLE